MHMADMIIIGAVVAFGLLARKWGILKPATGLGGLVLGVIAAINFSGQVTPLLVEYIDSERLREIGAFAAVVLAVVVGVRVAGVLLKKLLALLVLGWVDHVAGAAAGVVLGIVLTEDGGLSSDGRRSGADQGGPGRLQARPGDLQSVDRDQLLPRVLRATGGVGGLHRLNRGHWPTWGTRGVPQV